MNDEVRARRAAFEERLGALAERCRSETGWWPRPAAWILVLSGAAAGFALALRRRRRRRR